MTITFHGRVLNDVGTPLSQAAVMLTASLDVLGRDPQAAVLGAGVSWTRPLAGFSGSLWSCWQRHVAPRVAGLTWEAFRRDAPTYNPSLRSAAGRFQADRAYVLPENRSFADTGDVAPEIAWDRELTGFDGTVWEAWRRFVQLKVVGVRWPEFRTLMRQANPHLAQTGDALRSHERYRLPRHPVLTEHHRLAICDRRGRFSFDRLPAGAYHLEVWADGYRRLRRAIVLTADTALDLALEAIPLFDDRADPFVRTAGRELVFGGRALRFVGVNLRGLVHYGDKATLPFTEERTQAEQLQSAYEMGARVVRVFLPSEHADTQQTIDRFERLLGKMRAGFADMFLIVALTNLYADTPFKLAGDREFYARTPDNYELLGPAWFSEGYKRHYLPFVTEVVKRFRGERQILAWEPGNEFKVDHNPELLVQFMHAMARAIRGLDGNHLITTGMISTRHAYMQHRPELRRKLYDHPVIDFITVHAYNGKNKEDDSDLARDCNKPFIVEEAGFSRAGGDEPDEPGLHPCQNSDRSPCVQADMDKWFGRGACGYMQWGFMAGGDNGDGDTDSGMGPRFHGYDWEPLRATYRHRADALWQAAPAIADHRPLARVEPSGPAKMTQTTQAVKLQAAPAMLAQAAAIQPAGQLITTTRVKVRRTPGHLNKLAGDVLGVARPKTRVQPLGPTERVDGLDWSMVEVRLDTGQTVQGWMAHAVGGEALLVPAVAARL